MRVKALALILFSLALAALVLVQSPAPRTHRNAALSNRAASAAPPAAPQIVKAHLVSAYGKLPLRFEANKGQTDSRVRFLSRGRGYALFLTGDQAVLSLEGLQSSVVSSQSQRTKTRGHRLRTTDKGAATRDVLRMKLVGANPHAKVVGLDELPGKSNYFIGRDPAKWRTNVPNYAKVRYKDVYPGIDLVYYGNQGQLEYDFVVAPGADPSLIRLAAETGNSNAAVAANGDLVIGTGSGEVRLRKPVVYQQESEVRSQKPEDKSGATAGGNRQSLKGRYTLHAGNRVGFELGAYDRTLPLVIDPVLSYSTLVGGSGRDSADGIAVDSSGSAYITGVTESSDFPKVSPMQANYGGGQYDAFVVKLNPAGSALVYSTYLGGSSYEGGSGITVDPGGNAYVTGLTTSSDFPSTNLVPANATGGAFVTRLNAAGSGIVYSTILGGTSSPSATSIALDTSSNAYITGTVIQANSFIWYDVLVTKLDTAGQVVYSFTFGGSSTGGGAASDMGEAITVDADGNAYVTGEAHSSGFPTTPGAFQQSCAYCGSDIYSSGDAFVSKVDPTGTFLVYSTFLGSGHLDFGSGIAVDGSGNAYVTGCTMSAAFPTTPGAFQTSGDGSDVECDAFVTKLNPQGTGLVYSTYLSGNLHDRASGIFVDNSSGEAILTGTTSSSNFPTTPDAFPMDNFLLNGQPFVSRLNADGTGLVFSTYLGEYSADSGSAGIAVDTSGNIYVTGYTNNGNFPTTPGAYDTTCGTDGSCSYADAFVLKISLGGGLGLSPASLDFGDQAVGSTSTAKTVTLTNSTAAPVNVTSVSITGTNSGDFAQTNACSSLAPAGTCTISVTFKPTATGARSATLTIADDTGGSSTVPLSGTGTAPEVELAPTSLTFGTQTVGTTSSAQTVTLTNSGDAALAITSIAVSADFTQTNTCGTSVAAAGSCTISVSFKPTLAGSRSGTLTITDNAAGSPQTVALSGTAEGPPDFSLSVSPTSATVTAGGSATHTVTVTPGSGFTGAVALACTGAPTQSTCSVSPASVTPDGTNPVNATVTITTTVRSGVAPLALRAPWNGPGHFLTLILWLAAIASLLALARKRKMRAALAAVVLATVLWASCGGGGSSSSSTSNQSNNTITGTPAGTYTLTLTGTSGTLSHSSTVILTVN